MDLRWKTKWKWHTGYSADSVEWCPVEPYQNILVCGIYQLEKSDEQAEEKSKQKRLGRIYVFEINEASEKLHPFQTIDTSGVLDLKWCHHTLQGWPVLAAVTSEGFLELYRLVEENGVRNLRRWFVESIGEEVLALSLDWSTNRTHSEEPVLVISDSAGSVSLMKIIGDRLQIIDVWKAHGFEAWCAAFNYLNKDVFYSGGDDCAFKSFDARVPGVALTTNRSHEAGVTAIRSHVSNDHQLITGSYDEKVRLWDARNLKRSITETDVKGGVWRLKWHPTEPCSVIAACMYGGFRTIHLENEDITVTSEYLEHESIAYGADWKFDERTDFSLVATCSFYDCSLHVSEITHI